MFLPSTYAFALASLFAFALAFAPSLSTHTFESIIHLQSRRAQSDVSAPFLNPVGCVPVLLL